MLKSVLTIDDAPSHYFIDKLEFLSKEDIPAIFFIKGENVAGKFDWIVESIKRGYVLGNHTHSHRPSSRLSVEDLELEIETCEKIIENAYEVAGVSRPAKLFRFPFGDKGVFGDAKYPDILADQHYNNIQQMLEEKGFVNPLLSHLDNHKKEHDTYWTFNTKDWALRTGRVRGLHSLEDMKRRLEGMLAENEPLDVLLIHDHDYTHDLFPEIISHLRSLGVNFYLPSFSSHSK